MYIRDTPTLVAFNSDDQFPGSRIHLRMAVFASVLPYGISRGNAPERMARG